MAIARTGTSRAAAANTASGAGTITRPSGAATGELLLLSVHIQDAAKTIDTPTGWTLIEQNAGSDFTSALFWRLDDGSSPSATITWSGGGSEFLWWRCVSYSGVDTGDPFAGTPDQQVNASSATVTAPSVTPDVADALLVTFHSPSGSATSTWTEPASYTEIDTIANAVFYAERQLVGGSGSPTGAITSTISTARPNSGSHLALNPDTGGADTEVTPTSTGTMVFAGTKVTVSGDPPAAPETRGFIPPPPPEAPLRVLLADRDVTDLIEPGLSYSNVAQGGHEACQFNFARKMDVRRGQRIRIERGLGTVFEGRVQEVGTTSSRSGVTTQVSGVGNGAILKEQTYSGVYIDSDLSRWSGPSAQRKISLEGSYISFDPATDDSDPNYDGSLTLTIRDNWTSPFLPLAEAVYDAGEGNRVGKVYRSLVWNTTWVSIADANWQAYAYTADDTVGTNATQSNEADGFTGAAAVARYETFPTARRFVDLQWNYAVTPAGTAGRYFSMYQKLLTVYGDHGLDLRGADPGGLYAHDVIRHLVAQGEGVSLGDIRAVSDFIIRQLAFYDPAAIEDEIATVAKFERAAWGTWESPSIALARPVFDFHPFPDSPNVWVTQDQLVSMDLTSRLDSLFDAVDVTYSQPDGTTAKETVTRDDPELRRYVRGGRKATVDMGLGTAATAIAFGNFYLALQRRLARASGSVTVPAKIDGQSGEIEAATLKAGKDAIRVRDLDAELAFGREDFQISRVETTEGRDGPVTKIEIGGGPDLLEVFTARLDAATTLAAAG